MNILQLYKEYDGVMYWAQEGQLRVWKKVWIVLLSTKVRLILETWRYPEIMDVISDTLSLLNTYAWLVVKEVPGYIPYTAITIHCINMIHDPDA